YLSSPRSTKISRLSLHDALPISDSTVSPNDSSGVSFVQLELAFDKVRASECMCPPRTADSIRIALCPDPETEAVVAAREILRHRSEEHTSELQSRVDLVCRLLLE